jgi:hypothetical protein
VIDAYAEEVKVKEAEVRKRKGDSPIKTDT